MSVIDPYRHKDCVGVYKKFSNRTVLGLVMENYAFNWRDILALLYGRLDKSTERSSQIGNVQVWLPMSGKNDMSLVKYRSTDIHGYDKLKMKVETK